MTTTNETFQIPLEAAEIYESRFVPAVFAEWAPRVLEAAGVGAGDAVLDVACGTGIVARTALPVVGENGRVVGVDLNEAMLTVARRVDDRIDWRSADAAQLPFGDESFDTVVCQMALMFFPDRAAAFREMRRVVTPTGAVALCVPAGLDQQPAYAPILEVLARHAGADAVSLFSTYWSCGDLGVLTGLIESAGLQVARAVTPVGTARFASTDEAVATEVEGSPLGERITPETYAAIRAEAGEVMSPYVGPDGAVALPLAAHIVVARSDRTINAVVTDVTL